MRKQEVAVNQADSGLSRMSVAEELDVDLRGSLLRGRMSFGLRRLGRLNLPKTTLYSPAGFLSWAVSETSCST